MVAATRIRIARRPRKQAGTRGIARRTALSACNEKPEAPI